MSRLPMSSVCALSRDDAQQYFGGWNADLRARFMLIDLAEEVYFGPNATGTKLAASTLIHAADYLKDRVGYEMDPHPKGMIPLLISK